MSRGSTSPPGSAIYFRCPRCASVVEAVKDRSDITCESCGHRIAVPNTSEVKTLTVAELNALKVRAALRS